MDNFIHGKCLNGGSCNTHCQKFIPESGSRSCVDCGHNDSQHVLLACKVMCEGYQYLPKPVVDVPTAELIERKSQFCRGKVTSSTTTSVKALGKNFFVTGINTNCNIVASHTSTKRTLFEHSSIKPI